MITFSYSVCIAMRILIIIQFVYAYPHYHFSTFPFYSIIVHLFMRYPHHFLTYLSCDLCFLLFYVVFELNFRSFLVATKRTSLFLGVSLWAIPPAGLIPTTGLQAKTSVFCQGLRICNSTSHITRG